ncbi:MAG: transposase [Thermomicrobiales bacterium]|nr:transposase [Thermomicrobiales bacterium]
MGQALLAGFVNACQSDDAIVHLICLMPDHLHALIEVQSEGLVKIVGRAKSMTTRMWWTNGRQGTLWQKSFYDHGIRETHDFEATVKYILENPVRAGLVEEGETYPLIAGRLIAER